MLNGPISYGSVNHQQTKCQHHFQLINAVLYRSIGSIIELSDRPMTMPDELASWNDGRKHES